MIGYLERKEREDLEEGERKKGREMVRENKKERNEREKWQREKEKKKGRERKEMNKKKYSCVTGSLA